MRKTSIWGALVLIALGGAAHAQGPTPSAAPGPAVAAPPPVVASPAVAPPTPPVEVPAQPAAPMPTPVGMPAPASMPPQVGTQALEPARSERRIILGLSLLPMGLGKFSASLGGIPFSADAAFSYGMAVRVGYVVAPGLTIAFAPQGFLNVKPKEQGSAGARQYDIMARIEYGLQLAHSITVFIDMLPGYSLIVPPQGDVSKGLVLGFGGGAAIPVSEVLFADLDLGYQVGFQSLPATELNAETRTRYVRVALGIGARF